MLAAFAGQHARDRRVLQNFGIAYTCRIIDVPASTGYGEPIQKLFKLSDGERVVGALSLDPRTIGTITPAREGAVPPVHAVAVTSDGDSLRFGLDSLVEPSTRAGRRFARPADGAEVVGVSAITGCEATIAASRAARAMLCPVEEINFLSWPGARRHPDQAAAGRRRGPGVRGLEWRSRFVDR